MVSKVKSEENIPSLYDTFSLVEGVLDPVIVVAQERTIIYANTAAEQALENLKVNENLSISLRHPEILQSVDAVLGGEDEKLGEITFTSPIPRTFEFQVKMINIFVEEQGLAMLAMRDITYLKSADQMRQDFVANVSHELRSPISSLVGIIETLQGSASKDPVSQKKFLKIMSEEAARMSRLIDDLLSLSRVEVTEHVPPDEKIKLPDIVGSAVEILRGIANKKNMTIRFEEKSELFEILGDQDELMEVFQNLIDNGIKYGDENSEIEISIEKVDRVPETDMPGVCISFKNKGDGIDEEHLPRLTERFYRADKARSRNTGGTGLGLAIVKHIVSRHRGHLAIESFPGDTTTVSVFLPLYLK